MRNHRKNINIPNGMKGSKASRSKHSKGGSRKRHYQADFRNPSLTDYGRNTRNRGKRCSKQVQLTLMSAMQYHNMIWQEMQESENRRVTSLTPAGQSSTWLWEYRRILESHKTQNHTSFDYLKDTIFLYNHAAAVVEEDRRNHVAKAINWPDSLIAECRVVHSEDRANLFGKQIIKDHRRWCQERLAERAIRAQENAAKEIARAISGMQSQ